MRRFVAVSLLLVCALIFPGPGGAAIQLYRSIGHVRLGMTMPQPQRVLGKPDGVDRDPGVHKGPQFTGFIKDPSYRLLEYHTRSLYTIGMAKRAGKLRVVLIAYYLRGQKTPAGIGVGSPYSDVRLKYPRIRCAPLLVLGTYVDECVLRSPRGRETVFEIDKLKFEVEAVVIRDRV